MGPEHIAEVSRAATKGIVVVGVMRYVLFLAILGVVVSGATIDLASHNANPAAQAFQYAAGEFGFKLFGLIFGQPVSVAQLVRLTLQFRSLRHLKRPRPQAA